MKRFGLIGDGYIAKKHKLAIKELGHEIVVIYDPLIPSSPGSLEGIFQYDLDYVIICSPTNFHYAHTKLSLQNQAKVICEKPLSLPWEPIIDDDNINIVLQYTYADLPPKARLVEVTMVRDEDYFKSWKGNSFFTGGIFYHLFIHYMMLAIQKEAKFIGKVISSGQQIRKVDDVDLMKIDMDSLYIKMYEDILTGGGIKPKDIMFLTWVLNHCNWKYGLGKEVIGKTIHFDSVSMEWFYD
jgi:hypothetical protein